MNQELFLFLLALVSPIILALFGWGTIEVIRLIRSKVKNENLSGALERAANAVATAVGATTQVLVAELKEKASDGRLTSEEARQALNATLQRARDGLGANGLAELRNVLGNGDDALDKWLIDQIEARISDVKDGRVF